MLPSPNDLHMSITLTHIRYILIQTHQNSIDNYGPLTSTVSWGQRLTHTRTHTHTHRCLKMPAVVTQMLLFYQISSCAIWELYVNVANYHIKAGQVSSIPEHWPLLVSPWCLNSQAALEACWLLLNLIFFTHNNHCKSGHSLNVFCKLLSRGNIN